MCPFSLGLAAIKYKDNNRKMKSNKKLLIRLIGIIFSNVFSL